ncbi:MAG: tRNA (adenosine(37)-N6)-threonylcarbamoyltransferase complex transferase subunit TsaD, partial [Firmicutes bacterium]|nr:tRNA (adenosine(37)-N6)-threonylcarbamoyltransferase complex transferase subunit TsaD [Bacillota bacterium]
HHLDNINTVIDQALAEAGVTIDEIDLIGVTHGPGLIGALLIGVAAAKALSFAKDIPIVGVHHLHGHISANYIAAPELEPPFTAVVVSGGNTDIIDVKDYNDLELLGITRDDAAGEAMDKVARVLDLGYPGGPKIDALAKQGNPHAVEFKRVLLEKGSYDFSFSGLKTGVINHVHAMKQRGEEINKADIAASFQLAVMEVIVMKAIDAAKQFGRDKLALAGGVAANSLLRTMMEDACKKEGIEFYRPAPVLCTDNAAMISCAAYFRYKDGYVDDIDLDARPVLDF